MEWKKYSIGLSLSFLIPTFAILITFFSFYSERSLLFLIGVLLGVFTLLSIFYEKNLGKRLTINNPKEQILLFHEQEANWEISFRNEGFPIVGASVSIVFDKNVEPIHGATLQTISSYHIKVPFSIGFGQEKVLKIPVIAQKRGIAKIRSIEIIIPQIFGFGKTIMDYSQPFMQEMLVYPKTRAVGNLNFLESMKQGEIPVKQSIFQDYLAPVGSRDYVYSDSFKQVNWKATAKMQKLQTKVFETIADSGIHFNVNILDKYTIHSQLEEYIEHLAFMIYYLEKKKIPYSITINFRQHGQMPFFSLPKGQGKTQMQTALKMLSIMDNLLLPYSFEAMLGYYSKHMHTQPYIVHMGKMTDHSETLYNQLQRTGATVLQIVSKDGEGILQLRTGGRH